MKYLNLSFKTPEKNLSYDEELLEACEAGKIEDEILRFWVPKQHFVVLGYSNNPKAEVNELVAEKLKIPIFRRCSGGGTVLQGPGCLSYSLILRISSARELSNLVKTNYYILKKNQEALQLLTREKIEIMGVSDLAINNLKFSGNAQRRKKHFLLYHGTFLVHFNLKLIDKILKMPSRQPDYRNSRNHLSFLTNFPSSNEEIISRLRQAWNARQPLKVNFSL